MSHCTNSKCFIFPGRYVSFGSNVFGPVGISDNIIKLSPPIVLISNRMQISLEVVISGVRSVALLTLVASYLRYWPSYGISGTSFFVNLTLSKKSVANPHNLGSDQLQLKLMANSDFSVQEAFKQPNKTIKANRVEKIDMLK